MNLDDTIKEQVSNSKNKNIEKKKLFYKNEDKMKKLKLKCTRFKL